MSSKSQVAHYHLRRNTNGEIPERRYAPCVTPPWNTRSILKMTFSSYSIPQINCHPTANYYPTRFTLYQPDSSPHWISYRPLPRKTCGHLKKRNFFFFFCQNIPNQDGQWVNILLWALQLCCLLSERAGRQGNTVRAAKNSADVSVVFSQTEREKRWPSDNRQLSMRRHARTP